METKKKLSGREKFAYGLGAVGKDMVYMLSASYVLYYFQDIMGVNTIAMGVILLVARIFDAFNDPIMGVIVAKTKTRWGKFRPWLLIGTVTNAVLLFLMFAAPPSLDGGGLIAYAAVTYIIWGVTYTMMDIPYWSMIPAFTEAGKEREGLSALARSCAGVGSALITIITVMAVSMIGGVFADRADSITNTYNNANKNITAYVVQLDGEGNPTDKVTTYDSTKNQTTIEAEGVEKVFESGYVDVEGSDEQQWKGISFTQDNSKYELTINGVELNKDSADADANRITFVTDSEDAKDAAVVVSVKEDNYKKITSSDTLNLKADITSTLEVERLGFKYFALIIAILFIVFTLITCIVVKEKSSVDMEAVKIKDMFKALVQNDQAMTIVLAIVLINTATYITSNLLIYFFKYDLGGANWNGNFTLFNTFAGAVQIIAMMALFPLLRKFFSTLKIFYICVISGVVGYIVLFVMAIMGVNSVFVFFVPGFFIMAAVGILNVVVTVFLANTVDYGELKNYRRDESVIFSMQTFVVKFASGIAAMVAAVTLAVFDIQGDSTAVLNLNTVTEQVKNSGVLDTAGEGAVLGLRLIMTMVPILVLVIALVLFKAKYKLTDQKLDEINKELEARHAAEDNA